MSKTLFDCQYDKSAAVLMTGATHSVESMRAATDSAVLWGEEQWLSATESPSPHSSTQTFRYTSVY